MRMSGERVYYDEYRDQIYTYDSISERWEVWDRAGISMEDLPERAVHLGGVDDRS
jgi:hypothetical protein